MINLKTFLIWYIIGLILSVFLLIIEKNFTLSNIIKFIIISLLGPLLLLHVFVHLMCILEEISFERNYMKLHKTIAPEFIIEKKIETFNENVLKKEIIEEKSVNKKPDRFSSLEL